MHMSYIILCIAEAIYESYDTRLRARSTYGNYTYPLLMTLISLLGSAYKHSSSPLLVLSGGTRLPPPAARGARKYNDRVSCYPSYTHVPARVREAKSMTTKDTPPTQSNKEKCAVGLFPGCWPSVHLFFLLLHNFFLINLQIRPTWSPLLTNKPRSSSPDVEPPSVAWAGTMPSSFSRTSAPPPSSHTSLSPGSWAVVRFSL